MMTKKIHLIKCKSDMVKIVLYVVLMTTLLMSYCSNNIDETDKPIGYDYHPYYNEDIISSSENGNKIL